jgi:hypothetical protein
MRVIHRASIDKQDLRHMEERELSDLGVRLLPAEDLVLQCKECGETWTPHLDSSGKLPFDYWLCPARCNE